jgi:hypothetical protein
LIENQYNTAQAAKAPWMNTPRGGMQTHAITGQTIENPMESTARPDLINNDYELALALQSTDPNVRVSAEKMAQDISNMRLGRFESQQQALTKEWWKRPNLKPLNTSEGIVTFDPKRGKPGEVIAQPPATAEMRNKEVTRDLIEKSINAVKEYGDRIITKVGVAQRAMAIKRGAEAVLGHDSDFRVYQDARMALAGNLAVLQQGSRPSDADIKAIWMPMVPDVFADTKESAAKKWELIKTMSLRKKIDGQSASTPQIKSDEEYDNLPSGTIFTDPNGIQRKKP